MALRVFVDSDVIISSLISDSGAAYLLLHQTGRVDYYISNFSITELERVVMKLSLETTELKKLIHKVFKVIHLDESTQQLKVKYKDHVLDADDAHIVAGAHRANCQFLITYNTRHFKLAKIKDDFSVITITPASFLQYLRSIY